MDRKKSPALTSPGKVGFLVALLVVVTGLGVSYFITGTFGLQWNWIDLAGSSPSEWHFSFRSFAEEMMPLVALVALLAFAAYVLVSGAVRRYQASVSAGAEYRDLLRSFKTAEDFEDEQRLNELKPHPELREFVMGFRNRVAARERQLEEREKRQKNGEAPRPVAAKGGNGDLASECSVLLNAIVESKSGFSDALSLTIPELKQIERALRERLGQRMVVDDEPAKRELDALKASVDTTLASVRKAIAGARRDAGSCATGAREIEQQIVSLKQTIDALAVPAAASKGVTAAAKRVDAVAESLVTLGEDTKRVAIAAALSASGGSDGDAIKVAEEIRTIATRFNGIAQQWEEASPAIRSAIETIASGASGAEKRRAAALKALEGVMSKARLWGERMVALTETIDGLDRAAGGSGKTARAPAPATDDDWGLASLDDDAPAARETEPETPHGSNADTSVDDDFVTQRAANVFADTGAAGEDAPFADIPEFEKDPRLFAADADRKSGHRDEADPRFVVEREAGGEWNLSRGTQAAEAAGSADATHDDSAGTDDDFITGPAAKPTGKSPRRRIKVDDIAAAPADHDADAVDLYALGAVDWKAGVHA